MSPKLGPGSVEVVHLADPRAVAERAVALFVEAAQRHIAAHGQFSAALSGGSTPRLFHEALARQCAERPGLVDWSKVHLFFSDERAVPPEHEHSNYRMAAETLLGRVPVPSAHVHRVEADDGDAERGAAAYDATLARVLGAAGALPDLVMLGMGEDGHTASLFPGSVPIQGERTVVATTAPPASPVAARVSFSYEALARAEHVLAMITGAGKAKRLAEVLDGRHPGAATDLPMRRVLTARTGGTTLLVDRAAAAELGELHRSFGQ